jgi:shikimate kinase
MKRNIYYLTGFMASGKSTIGPILANTLGWSFFDIDKEIEKKEGIKVTQIFKLKGEKYFRSVESEILKNLSQKNNVIISLGGGTIADSSNFKIIKSTGKLIYLKSSPEMAYKRLRYKTDRPSLYVEGEELPAKEQLLGKINELQKNRKVYYESSDFVIDTDVETVGKTVDKIARYIKRNRINKE